jgi:hypothetical protein
MIDGREAFAWMGRAALDIVGVVEHIGFADTFNNLVAHLATAPDESATFVIGGDYVGQWELLVGSGPNVFGTDVLYPVEEEKFLRAALHIETETPNNRNPLPGVHPNRWTISKQHVGYPGDVWSETMMANDRACNEYIMQRLGRKAFRHILAHSDFDNTIQCPGPSFPWTWMYRKARFIDMTAVMIAQSIPREDLETLQIGDHRGWKVLYDTYARRGTYSKVS